MRFFNNFKFIFYSFAIIIIVSFFFVFGTSVSADQLMGNNLETCTYNGQMNTWGIYYIDTPEDVTNISKIEMYLDLPNLQDYRVKFCHGPYDPTVSIIQNIECNGNAQFQLASEIFNNVPVTSGYEWVEFDLEDFGVMDRANNFFSIKAEGLDAYRCIQYDSYDYGAFGKANLADYDVSFRIDYNPNWSPDDQLLQWRSDINTVEGQICWLGSDCNLWFSYNNLAIDKTVYLLEDIYEQHNPTFSLDSVVIEQTPIWQNKLSIPAETEEQYKYYCLYLEDEIWGDLLSCGIGIDWVATSTFEDLFYEDYYNMETVCNSISTSSGSFADDFRYGIECSVRKVFYWAFFPHPETTKNFVNVINDIKGSFPFSAFFDLTSHAKETLENEILNKEETFKIPIIDEDKNITLIPIISSTTIPNAIGTANNSFLRITLGYLMWITTAVIIIVIIV